GTRGKRSRGRGPRRRRPPPAPAVSGRRDGGRRNDSLGDPWSGYAASGTPWQRPEERLLPRFASLTTRPRLTSLRSEPRTCLFQIRAARLHDLPLPPDHACCRPRVGSPATWKHFMCLSRGEAFPSLPSECGPFSGGEMGLLVRGVLAIVCRACTGTRSPRRPITRRAGGPLLAVELVVEDGVVRTGVVRLGLDPDDRPAGA